MEEKRLENRIFNFAVSAAKFVGRFSPHGINVVIYRQLLRSALSVGANWQEAVGGLTDADFAHSANIAKKEVRETAYWLKIMKELKIGEPAELNALYAESCELVLILTSIVKKVQDKSRARAPKKILTLLLSLILNPLAFSLSFSADWPMFRGNEQRTGYTREQAYPPLTWKWDFQIQGDVVSSPVVYDGIVYVGARSGSIYALDAKTGELIWDYSTDGWIDASPAVSSGAVYITSRDGNLYALNRLNGALLWQAALGAPSISSPLVFGGKVYAGTGAPGNRLKVFDCAAGKFLWEYKAKQPVESSPATDGSGVFFGSNDGRMYALDMVSYAGKWGSLGQTVGTYGIMTAAVSSPAVYAVPSGNTGEIYKLDPSNGNELGKYEPYAADYGLMETASPVLAGNRVYYSAGNSPHTLYCLDSADLGFISSVPALGNTSAFGMPSSPALAGGVIYAGTADGRLVAVSSSGAVLQEIILPSPSHSSPAVSNGYVFIGTMGGKLWAYKADKIASISTPGEYELVRDTITIKGYIKNPALSGYSLEYGAGAEPSSWTFISSAAAASEIENGILGYWSTQSSPNGLYTLRLSVLPSSQDDSALTTVRVNYPPLPPSNLAASDVLNDAGNKIQLNWTQSASMVTGYKIYRSSYGVFNLLSEAGSNAVSFTDSAAPTGVLFTYLVRAYDGYLESADSNHAAAASVNDNPQGDVIPPAGITDLSAAQGAKGGNIVLSWTAPGDDNNVGMAASYLIRYSTNSGFDWINNFDGAVLWKSSRAVTGAAGTAETETVTGLFGGVTYYFAIKAADDIPNLSPVSNAATAWATLDFIAPGAPSGLAVSDTDGDHGGRLTLGWTISPDDGAGENDVYGYKAYRSRVSGQYISSAPYAVVPAGETGYLDTDAPVNLKFYYTVAAFDSTNNSALTAEAWGISADNWRFFDASQGGSVRLEDGMEVNIPRNSVNQNDNIMITKLNPAAYQPQFTVKANTGANPTGVVYEVKFENPATKLLKNAALSLPYTDADAAGMDPENLRIYTLSGGAWMLLNTSKAYPGLHKVTAETNHFSYFRIMEYVPSGALLSKDSVYTYPNPAKGDSVTFKFYLAYKAYVKVEVYNVAGEKVARLERPNCPAGSVSEIVWNIKNVASGVYQYRVEATSASGSKHLIKRLAVIH